MPSAAGTAPGKLPLVVRVLAAGTFLMGTSEFVIAGLLPDMAGDLGVSVSDAGLLITAFAIGVIIGGPAMARLTLLPLIALAVGGTGRTTRIVAERPQVPPPVRGCLPPGSLESAERLRR
ncbi:hypothetical protein GCM10010271_29970 [Streptomyces kurssanovii]|nr:hypothetical protein GCM10010271_29970 [Streptomyces kurssanovii]